MTGKANTLKIGRLVKVTQQDSLKPGADCDVYGCHVHC